MRVSKEIRDLLFYNMQQKLNIKEIIDYPLIGRVVKSLKDEILVIEKELPKTIDGIHFKFNWDDKNNLIEINVGTKWSGPMLSWNDRYKWRNIYNFGNYEKNYTTGGGSTSNYDEKHNIWQEALKNRNYIVPPNNIGFLSEMRDCRFKESQSLLDHVHKVISEFEAS